MRNDPFISLAYKQVLAKIRELGAMVVNPAKLPSTDEMLYNVDI